MASDTMEKVIEVGGFEDGKGCQTDGYTLEGGDGWYPTLFIRLVQDYGMDIEASVQCCKIFIKYVLHLRYVEFVIVDRPWC